MSITLHQFERIDTRLSHLLRMGPFETCEWPRGYITQSNRLLDACIDAMGMDYVKDFASAEECAAAIVTEALLSSTFVEEDV
jgi:hypothetical protein